jgi:hypothetical protein
MIRIPLQIVVNFLLTTNIYGFATIDLESGPTKFR